MQQPLALIGIQGTIFSEHEVFRVHDFEIVFIFTLSIFFKKCENNESTRNTCLQQPLAVISKHCFNTMFQHEVF